jgi:hypothetical protein
MLFKLNENAINNCTPTKQFFALSLRFEKSEESWASCLSDLST